MSEKIVQLEVVNKTRHPSIGANAIPHKAVRTRIQTENTHAIAFIKRSNNIARYNAGTNIDRRGVALSSIHARGCGKTRAILGGY